MSGSDCATLRCLHGKTWNRKKRKRAPVHVPDFGIRSTQRQQDAFEDVRSAIADPMILVPPRTGARKRVVSDASNVGYGAVLLQFEPFSHFANRGGWKGAIDSRRRARLRVRNMANGGLWLL
jgi:RNase H-like domain found in reverse transcriptase